MRSIFRLACAAIVLTTAFSPVPVRSADLTSRPAKGSDRLAGQLLDPDGKPLAGVRVCLCTRWLDVYNADLPPAANTKALREWATNQGISFVSTDGQGRFSFPPPSKTNYSLLVSTDAGYVIAKASTLTPPITLRLTRWARLVGVVKAGDKPAHAGTKLLANIEDDSLQDEIGPYLHFQATTDQAGRFCVDRIFAGDYQLVRLGEEDATGVPVKATLPAGKTTEVTVPVVGWTVAGRIEIPEGLRQHGDLFIQSTLEAPVELPAIKLPGNVLQMSSAQREAWSETWEKSAEGQRALAARARQRELGWRVVRMKRDGSFNTLDVSPGTYTIAVQFFAVKKEIVDYEHRLALRSYTLTVPPMTGAAEDAVLKVGPLPGHPYGLADAGQTAPDFMFRTLDGKESTLSQLRGKVVLLDFWGTWCGSCVAELPRLKEIHAAFGKDQRFVMISLSVRDEPARVARFAREHRMDWIQVALGDEGKTVWPVKLYQATGYPTFWLIGRDGKVVAHGHWLDDLKPVIAKTLDASAGQH